MIIFSVLEMQDGDVIDLRHYGRDDLAREDLVSQCNPEHDSRFAGSCMIESDIFVAKIAGQRKSTAKSKAASKRNRKRAKEGKHTGRPIVSGDGIKDPVRRAQVKEKLYSEGKLERPPQPEPKADELDE